jgi:AraC-like DNA-binding protein/mannose-6-phosphate isomerase-like protein (cupin superfamily)
MPRLRPQHSRVGSPAERRQEGLSSAIARATERVPMELSLSHDANRVWQYWRPPGSGVIELGMVRGREVALPTHFHEEDQITFVLSGRRSFIIGDELVVVTSGQGVHIPAGTPHRSLSESSGVNCFNLYTSPGTYAVCDLLSGLGRLWLKKDCIGWCDLSGVLAEYRCGTEPSSEWLGAVRVEKQFGQTVSQAAQRAGMSREGFSRRFRKLHGMAPHAFWLLQKLNDARRLLRTGECIAAVAEETGFADQSHLGRCFKRAFGVTPGRYRTEWLASHLF